MPNPESYVAIVDENGDFASSAITGTGAEIPLPLEDPGNDDWSEAIEPNPIARDCMQIILKVGNSGVDVSFDGGETIHWHVPAGCMWPYIRRIQKGCDVRVKRATPGVPMTALRGWVR